MRRAHTTIVVLLVALVGAACGGDEAADTTSTTATTIVFTSTTVATTTTTQAETTTTAAPGPAVGATDTTVRVQLDLKALGFFDGQIDGIAGELTQAALKEFQTQQGISADGEFGPQTDLAMYPLLMEDAAYVENLQDELEHLGIYSGPIDGDYGKGTTAAVKTLQGSCDLEETGLIDIATRICLDSAD